MYDWTKGQIDCMILFDNSVKKNIQLSPICMYSLRILSEEKVLVQKMKTQVLSDCLNEDEFFDMIQFLYENNLVDIVQEGDEYFLISMSDYSSEKRCFDRSLIQNANILSNVNAFADSEQLLQTLKYYQGYITGFLSNVGPMSLSKLHGFLQKFIQGQMKFSYSVEELKLFMDSLIEDAIVKYDDNSNEYKPAK